MTESELRQEVHLLSGLLLLLLLLLLIVLVLMLLLLWKGRERRCVMRHRHTVGTLRPSKHFSPSSGYRHELQAQIEEELGHELRGMRDF
jgi:hypothetical protein